MKTNSFHNFILCLAFLCFGIPTITAQDKSESAKITLEKSRAFFEASPLFQAHLTYTLFRDRSKPKLIEQYKGQLVKRDQDLYMKIHNTEFLLLGANFVKVNHDQKALELIKASTKDLSQNPIDIAKYLNLFKDVEQQQKGDRIICKLTTPKYTQLPYGAIELIFDAKTMLLEEQILTLVNPGRIPDENGSASTELKYLSIKINEFSTQVPKADQFFNLNDYVVKKVNGAALAQRFEDYQLIDRTTK